MTEIHPTAAEIAESIDRIARTADGANLYVLLQRRVMSVAVPAIPGALRADHGERSFASKLIGLMARGIYESGGRTSNGDTSGTGSEREQPVIAPIAGPRAFGGSAVRAAARAQRIAAIDIGGTVPDTGASDKA